MLFQGDAPEGRDTFQWPVIERDRVCGLRLIIWDKVKVLLCHYRVMHRKRVTSELHDSYFRLMTINHSISKIEWASNDYITQGVRQPVELKIGRSYRRDVVGKATSGRRGLWAQMSWGPEKMLIRCRKESHHPAEWPLDLRLSIKEQERYNVTAIRVRGQNISVMFGLQFPLTRKPWTTLSNPGNKVRGKYFYKEVFLHLSLSLRLCHCVLIYCVSMYPAWTCICVYKHIYYVSI